MKGFCNFWQQLALCVCAPKVCIWSGVRGPFSRDGIPQKGWWFVVFGGFVVCGSNMSPPSMVRFTCLFCCHFFSRANGSFLRFNSCIFWLSSWKMDLPCQRSVHPGVTSSNVAGRRELLHSTPPEVSHKCAVTAHKCAVTGGCQLWHRHTFWNESSWILLGAWWQKFRKHKRKQFRIRTTNNKTLLSYKLSHMFWLCY